MVLTIDLSSHCPNFLHQTLFDAVSDKVIKYFVLINGMLCRILGFLKFRIQMESAYCSAVGAKLAQGGQCKRGVG